MTVDSIYRAQARYTRDEVFEASLNYFNGDTLAADVFTNKYALRDPHNSATPYAELTPDDMHNRLSFELARIDTGYQHGQEKVNAFLKNAKYSFEVDSCGMIFTIESKDDSDLAADMAKFFHTWRESMHRFKRLVPQGSPMAAMGNPFTLSSLSNCTVITPPEDNMSSIIMSGANMANLYKRRAGVGVDISTLRPYQAPVNNSALSSTGAYSFSNYYSNVTRMVGQNGRRGALMVTIDIKHPDADRFTTMKLDLTFCTGANISLRVTDEFMQAVEDKATFDMVWPCNTNIEEYLQNTKGEWVEEPEIKQTLTNYQGDMVESVIAVASKYFVPENRKSQKVVLRRVKAVDLWI